MPVTRLLAVLPLVLSTACTSGDARVIGDGPVELQTLSCFGDRYNSGTLDYATGAKAIPESALPEQLDRLTASSLTDRWPDARLTVAFQDDHQLDAVADVTAGREAIYRFNRPPDADGWRLSQIATC